MDAISCPHCQKTITFNHCEHCGPTVEQTYRQDGTSWCAMCVQSNLGPLVDKPSDALMNPTAEAFPANCANCPSPSKCSDEFGYCLSHSKRSYLFHD